MGKWNWFFFAAHFSIPPGSGDSGSGSEAGWTDPDDTPVWFWDSIADAISEAIGGFLEALRSPFVVIGEAIDNLGEGIMNIGANIWSFFYEPLQDIWNGIVSLPSQIVSGIQEVFTFLFVPDEQYFQNKFNDIKTRFVAKIGVDGDDLEVLQGASGANLDSMDGFRGTIYGQSVKFVDFSFLDGILPAVHNLARGFVYPLLVLYNMNQVYFLIRGVKLFGKGGKEE